MMFHVSCPAPLLLAHTSRALAILTSACASFGFAVNCKPGKTEVLLAWHGPQSHVLRTEFS
eukprot:1587907-Alexandrium_andersonii.AAC.1